MIDKITKRMIGEDGLLLCNNHLKESPRKVFAFKMREMMIATLPPTTEGEMITITTIVDHKIEVVVMILRPEIKGTTTNLLEINLMEFLDCRLRVLLRNL